MFSKVGSFYRASLGLAFTSTNLGCYQEPCNSEVRYKYSDVISANQVETQEWSRSFSESDLRSRIGFLRQYELDSYSSHDLMFIPFKCLTPGERFLGFR